MSRSFGFNAMKCPICGSWDTVYGSNGALNSDLWCRPCGRIVWDDDFRGDGETVECVYYADGSIKESTFVDDDEIYKRIYKEPVEHDHKGRPIVRSLEEVWPADKMDKVTVRQLHS